MEAIEKIKAILKQGIGLRASDLHILGNEYPVVRIDGKLHKLGDGQPLTFEESEEMILATMRPDYVERLKKDKEVDFSFNFDGSRVRANVFFNQGTIASSFRFITQEIKLFDQLGLPPIIQEFGNREQGLVIICGPTGHGKSTTIAALIEYINQNFPKHIITVEDPVEYVFKNKKSIVTQRELGTDTLSFPRALRSVLREDPDVVFIGEMRDVDTFEAALTIAETGHLVFTTLHTNDAAQTANRVIDVFPREQQIQVRQQLASVIAGVVSQRLIQRSQGGGRIVACEIMIANQAIKSQIRDGKTHQIEATIQTSASEGMITLDKVLADYVSRGEITLEEALKWASDPRLFKQMVF